jgi:hypothetical protein
MVVVLVAGVSAGVGKVSQTPAGTNKGFPNMGRQAGLGLPDLGSLGVAGRILDPGTEQ